MFECSLEPDRCITSDLGHAGNIRGVCYLDDLPVVCPAQRPAMRREVIHPLLKAANFLRALRSRFFETVGIDQFKPLQRGVPSSFVVRRKR